MLKIGLCGGIASGKSTISRLFESLGVAVIDTDTISHHLMQPGQIAYQKTLDNYGHQILQTDASINRKLLREIVFNDAKQKLWLENMLHPLIRDEAIRLMQLVDSSPYILLVVPLMYETGFDSLVDHVIAIDCPRQVQISRLIERDGINTMLADKILDAQMDNEQRLSRADSIILNDDDSDPTERVTKLHRELTQLSNNFIT
jgi:dephospho-CoA kinase